MKVVFAKEKYTETTADMLVVLYIKNGKNPLFKKLDSKSRGALAGQAQQEKFSGEENRVLEWYGKIPGVSSKRIVVVGVGKGAFDCARWRLSVSKCINVALRHRVKTVAVFVDAYHMEASRVATEALVFSAYRFSQHKTAKKGTNPPTKGRVGVYDFAANTSSVSRSIREGFAGAQGVVSCRDLVNQPANFLGPAEFEETAKQISLTNSLDCTVIKGADLRSKGMGLIAAVGNASTREPALLHLVYKPENAIHKVALIGKGITFDSGGLCLKPPASMYSMKTDMGGAAVVLSAMSVLHRLDIGVEVHGIIPLADNAIGASAVRPGDVIRAYSGLNVEILNTDAEGRLVLADALAYASEIGVDAMIDFATLTGACSVALGNKRAAMFSNRKEMATEYELAAKEAGELLWQMPLATELARDLNSDIGDVKNIGGRFGGTITAALFLEKFVQCDSWIHMDIAGPSRNDAVTSLCPKGGTGYGVLTCLEYLAKL